jgi:hypothetical protein
MSSFVDSDAEKEVHDAEQLVEQHSESAIPIVAGFFNAKALGILQELRAEVTGTKIANLWAMLTSGDESGFGSCDAYCEEPFFAPMPSQNDTFDIYAGIVIPHNNASDDSVRFVEGTPMKRLCDVIVGAPLLYSDFMKCDNGDPGFRLFSAKLKALENAPLGMRKYDFVNDLGVIRFKVHHTQPMYCVQGTLQPNEMHVVDAKVATIEIVSDGLEIAKVSGDLKSNSLHLVLSNPMLDAAKSAYLDKDALRPYLKAAHHLLSKTEEEALDKAASYLSKQ